MTDTNERSLTLALQEGFDDDTVLITAGGRTLQRLEHVSTRNQIGLARELSLIAPAGVAALEIVLPDKGIVHAVPLGAEDGLHYGASIDAAGTVDVRRSPEPFGYV